jgi:hypothetical protein
MARIYAIDERDAFGQGVVGRALGRKRSSNPHPPRSAEFAMWEAGWSLIDPKDCERATSTGPSAATFGHLYKTPLPGTKNAEAGRQSPSPFILYIAALLASGGFFCLIVRAIIHLQQ